MPPDDVVHQAGAVVFRRADGAVEILLVSPKDDPDERIFPKGHIEPGERPDEAAVRETREEAGVTGQCVRPLEPALAFRSNDEDVRVRYFLIEAKDWSGKREDRQVEWLAPQEALARLSHDDAKAVLLNALREIDGG